MSLLFHRPLSIRPSITASRSFSSTIPRSISLQLEKNDPDVVADTIPAYPYGPAQWYKQSNLGLYGGKVIQFGNNVGPKSKYKTRRSWHPNIFNKRLYSRALGRHIQLRVSTRVLRTIDKLGGLDEYLLGDKEARIKELGITGWWLRWAIMQTPKIRQRFNAEREALGLPEKGVEKIIQEEATTEQAKALLETNSEASLVGAAGVLKPVTQRIKFRAAPKAHLYYTPDGWRRAKPDPERRFKERMRKENEEYLTYYYEQLNKALAEVDKIIERQTKKSAPHGSRSAQQRADQTMLDRQRIALRQRVRNAVTAKAEEIIQALWEKRVARVRTRKLRKPLRKARIMMTREENATFRPKTRAEVRAWIRKRNDFDGHNEVNKVAEVEASA